MAIQTGQASYNLKSGRQWYAYSGVVQGGPTIPAFVTLIDILSTGLKDCFVKIQPSYGKIISTTDAQVLGLLILIDDVEIINNQHYEGSWRTVSEPTIELFVPRQSRLTVKSINTADNTLQERGVTVLGWYL